MSVCVHVDQAARNLRCCPCLQVVKPKRFGYIGYVPTVLRAEGFAFRIYTKDHPPAHVHVVWGRGNLKVYLESERPPELRGHVSVADVRRAVALVATHYDALLAAWHLVNPQP